MPQTSTHRRYYRTKPGLSDILREAGIGVGTYLKSGHISKDTYDRIRRGEGAISQEIKIKVVEAVRIACEQAGLNEKKTARYYGQAQALWSEVPYGAVIIHYNDPLRLRLNQLAALHRMSRFEYFARLFDKGRDPLGKLN